MSADLRGVIARAIADAQNVPFVGPKQRKIADAVLAVILGEDETLCLGGTLRVDRGGESGVNAEAGADRVDRLNVTLDDAGNDEVGVVGTVVVPDADHGVSHGRQATGSRRIR